MPTVIIPDKICPHCGGNEWCVTHRKRKIWEYTEYQCILKKREYHREYQRIYNREYEKNRKIRLREELSDSYIKSYIAGKRNVNTKDITSEEIVDKRAQIKKWRDLYKTIPKDKKQSEYHKKYDTNSVLFLADSYIKKLIRKESKKKGILINTKDIQESEIIKRRALVLANRKGKLNTSYVKTCVQSAILKSEKIIIPFNKISKRKVANYRKGLRTIRYFRELQKLTTI